MSFNALSITKIGIGFGALAVASIGLLSPAHEVSTPQYSSAGYGGHISRRTKPARQHVEEIEALLLAGAL